MKPFIGVDLKTARLNRTLHGRSVYRPKDVPSHNVFRGYTNPGTGDGLDVFAPAGTPVFSPITGKVSLMMDDGGSREGIYIEGNGYTVVLAHINVKAGIVRGSAVLPGQVVGYVGKLLKDAHLHAEVWAGNKSISGNTARRLAFKMDALLD